eukprot:gene6303-1125_t
MFRLVYIAASAFPLVLGQPQCIQLESEGLDGSLACPDGQAFDRVDFASYGNPSGLCGRFTQDDACHSPDSVARLEDRCLGLNHCRVIADDQVFGKQCIGQKLYVQLNCAPFEDLFPETCREVTWDLNNVNGRTGAASVQLLGTVANWQECRQKCFDAPTCQTYSFYSTYHSQLASQGQCHSVTDTSWKPVDPDVNAVTGLCCKNGATPDPNAQGCVYSCNPSCGRHGRCTAPNTCSCDIGWIHDGNSGEPGFQPCSQEACQPVDRIDRLCASARQPSATPYPTMPRPFVWPASGSPDRLPLLSRFCPPQCVSWGDTHLIPSCGGDLFDW